MLDTLYAPVPFIVGTSILTAALQEELHGQADLVIVDVQKDKIRVSSAIPSLPEAKKLRERLTPLHRSLYDRSIADENPFHTNEEREPIVQQIRHVFSEYNEWIRDLALNFEAIPRNQYARRDLMKATILERISPAHQELVGQVLDTQYFAHYLDYKRRLPSTSSDENQRSDA